MTEVEKFDKTVNERNIIKNFLDYANEKGFFLCIEGGYEQSPEYLMLETIETEGLIDEYFGIDSDKLIEENREALRKRSEENEL